MLVDEVLLQHERLVLVLHHEVVEAVRIWSDQKRDLRALVLVVHVLAHASAQLLRLAHVDDLAGLVLPQVHARQRGHGVQLLLDALELGGERIVGGAIPALAHGAVERGPAAALALEALGGLGIGWFVGVPALEAARIGGFDAAVGNARYDIREEALHAASAIAHEAAASQDARRRVPLLSTRLHRRSRCRSSIAASIANPRRVALWLLIRQNKCFT